MFLRNREVITLTLYRNAEEPGDSGVIGRGQGIPGGLVEPDRSSGVTVIQNNKISGYENAFGSQ